MFESAAFRGEGGGEDDQQCYEVIRYLDSQGFMLHTLVIPPKPRTLNLLDPCIGRLCEKQVQTQNPRPARHKVQRP